MEKVRRVVFVWSPVVLWMGLIFFLSSFHKLQASPISWQDFVIRKTAHFLEYAILYILLYRGLTFTSGLAFKKRLIISLAMTIFYAFTDELHQNMVNGRTGRFFDIGIDSLGALGGLLFVLKLVKYLPEKLKKELTV